MELIDAEETKAWAEAFGRKMSEIAATLDARDAERARREAAHLSVARETQPPYGDIAERLDRIEGALAEMRDQMATKRDLEELRRTTADLDEIHRTLATLATKVELEAMSDGIKKVADGYQTTKDRLDFVAELLKTRVV